MAALQRLRFDWRDALSPYAYASALSAGLQHGKYADADLLLGLYHVPLVRLVVWCCLVVWSVVVEC